MTVPQKPAIATVIEQAGQFIISEKIKSDTMTITLQPDQAAEVKLKMTKGMSATFGWQADAPVNFDTHGDPVPYRKGFYHEYGKGRGVTEDKGTLTAAFDGKHGWFWRNRSGKTVTLTLQTQGAYEEIKRVL